MVQWTLRPTKTRCVNTVEKTVPAEGVFVYQAAQIVSKNEHNQTGFFLVGLFHAGHAFQLRRASCEQWYLHVEHNDNQTLKQHPSSKHSYLPACLPTLSIWYYLAISGLPIYRHLSLYGSLHFATCPLGNAKKVVFGNLVLYRYIL